MSVIVLLIVFSLIVAIIFLVLFIWSVKSGQYDDTYSPSVRILFDEKKQNNKDEKEHDAPKNSDKTNNSTEN